MVQTQLKTNITGGPFTTVIKAEMGTKVAIGKNTEDQPVRHQESVGGPK